MRSNSTPCAVCAAPIPPGNTRFCSNACSYASRFQDVETRFWRYVNRDDTGCWEWQAAISQSGYGRFGHNRDGRSMVQAHRFSWELHHGPIPDGLCVLHHCDNRRCVRPDHLFIGTQKDNADDMWSKGRGVSQTRPELILRGERHPEARFTWEQVEDIRRRFAEGGVTIAALSREFGSSHESMRRIVHRITWKQPR